MSTTQPQVIFQVTGVKSEALAHLGEYVSIRALLIDGQVVLETSNSVDRMGSPVWKDLVLKDGTSPKVAGGPDLFQKIFDNMASAPAERTTTGKPVEDVLYVKIGPHRFRKEFDLSDAYFRDVANNFFGRFGFR